MSSRRPSTLSFRSLGGSSELFAGVVSESVPSSLSVRSGMHSPDSSGFHFFNQRALDSAQGAATRSRAGSGSEYDWDRGHPRPGSSTASSVMLDYGSIDGSIGGSSLHGSPDNAHPGSSSGSSTRSSCSSTYPQPDLRAEMHSRLFTSHPAGNHLQKFYISEEDLMIAIAGYRTSKSRLILFYILSLLTGGIFYLLLRWLPKVRLAFYGVRTTLAEAEWVLIETESADLTTVKVYRQWYNRHLSSIMNVPEGLLEGLNETDPTVPALISFTYRYLRFYYSPVEDIFKTNTDWVDSTWTRSPRKGLDRETYQDRCIVFDRNSLNLEPKPTSQLLIDEILHPFYIFQIFSIILWSLDEYYYYAFCIFLISVISIINTLVETKSTMQKLSELSKFECSVRVWRNDFWKEIDSSDLRPGDIYEVSDPSLSIFPADSILISGDCIVNEAMLTGESVPVSKLPANEETLRYLVENSTKDQIPSELAKSYLFSGTKIIRVRHPAEDFAMALVVKTGFSTVKGSLLRSMLFPKSTSFKFYKDSFKYIGVMTLVALFGFTFSIINFINLNLPWRTIILRALDIITIVIPPALPATLTIGTNFAITRLKKKEIFCIAPTKVNISGKLDVLCFDKTGTLTEDELDIFGIHACGESFDELLTSASSIEKNNEDLLKILVACHSLRILDDEMIGDPLDYKMFKFTNWNYQEEFQNFTSVNEERFDQSQLYENVGITPAIVYPQNDQSKAIGIVRSFEFVSNLRRMSVIIKSENQFQVLTKGAPEIIKNICKPESFPKNYDVLLNYYAHNGYRVIGCASKLLKKNTWLYSQKITRDEAENDLTFLGFIIFENKLKTHTRDVLKELNDAKLRTIMCTGDNLLTAISVSKQCGLVKEKLVFTPSFDNADGLIWTEINDENLTLDPHSLELYGDYQQFSMAISGDIFQHILKNHTEMFSEDYLNRLLLKTNVFARMSPEEKNELVEQLQKLDYTVGFCGDGANDCGALKSADVGISLSEAEASVAAPFTSRVFQITCVIDIIKEGRASLVTSFSCFQYMSLYSAIQFITIAILYKRGSNLGDFQYLWIDLFLILPIAIFMSWSGPFSKIVPKRPSANLISPKLLIPLIINIFLMLIFQLIAWASVQRQSWYIKPVPAGDDFVQSSDNTVLFLYSNFQYILCALILTKGPPYRQPLKNNLPFILNIFIAVLLSISLMNVSSDGIIGKFFQLTKISRNFKLFMVGLAITNFVTNSYIPPKFRSLYKKKRSHKIYKRILDSWNSSKLV